jgi:SagB-type dehydrogenase family enzyme
VLGEVDLGGGLRAMRKRVPSGGGMHPIEAYPLVIDVEGLTPGWYHYRAHEHVLAPILTLAREDARARIERLAAGQRYFAGAAMIVALSLRFPRHHWKYARHARAYRVMLMETGHVGQTFYLAATELGLGAFFTAAINDADIDAELGLDGVEEGCVALLGCGFPAADGAAMRLSHYVASG